MFENDKQETPAPKDDANIQTDTQSAELATLLSSIKNENGEQKYKSLPDALKALQHSQSFIPALKQEKTDAENRLQAMQQQLEELNSLKETVAQLTQRRDDSHTKVEKLDDEKLASVVQAQLERQRIETERKKNKEAVEAALVKKFGDKAGEVFYGKAKELGLSVETIQELAASSPAAIYSMLGVSEAGVQRQPSTAPIQGRVNTAALNLNKGESYIGRETVSIPIGGGHVEQQTQMDNARKMVDELREQGLTINDLTDPKVYNKFFR